MSTPDVCEVGQPLEISGHCVKVDEEAAEEKDWDGRDRTEEDGHLQNRGTTNNISVYMYNTQMEVGRRRRTCSDVAAPMMSPRDCATSDV